MGESDAKSIEYRAALRDVDKQKELIVQLQERAKAQTNALVSFFRATFLSKT